LSVILKYLKVLCPRCWR